MLEQVVKTERFHPHQLRALQSHLGFGAMIIDWRDIDYAVGRGIMEGDSRCLWNKDGRRIDIIVSRDGGLSATQTKEPDPYYLTLKAGTGAGITDDLRRDDRKGVV